MNIILSPVAGNALLMLLDAGIKTLGLRVFEDDCVELMLAVRAAKAEADAPPAPPGPPVA